MPMTHQGIAATYMRGGTSKGLFLRAESLPPPGAERDRLLLRIIGSPDPYGKHIDGMGGATSSTSKVVLVSKSTRHDSDVDYWFGAVAIDAPIIDWSGNCGNLTAAVGPFALRAGLVGAPGEGRAVVRLWQANIGKRIIAHVPVSGGQVLETGDFTLDGVAFPGAEIPLEFLDPAEDGQLFPTGKAQEVLQIPWVGPVRATLINAGNPTLFVPAETLGLTGTELQKDVNSNSALLTLAEELRAHGAVAMGLASTTHEATASRPHTPKLVYVAKAQPYTAADGRPVAAHSIDLLARTFSMGVLHHAVPGTAAVALATAAAIPGTLVNSIASPGRDGRVRFGHPSGTLAVGADVEQIAGRWIVRKVMLSRSARRLMEGWVYVPTPAVG
jgi:2-methylaconitate isomerase